MRWLTFGVLLLGGLAHAQDAGVPAPAEVAAPPDAGVSADDEALLKEIAAATAGPAPGAAPAPAPAPVAAPAAARGSSSAMFSNLYNPALSLNGLLLGTATTGAAGGNQASVSVQEIELQIISNVDPYFSASAILSIPGLSGLEVEEGYITLLPQPFGISLRGGKVRVPFGRENAVHTHALPFVDRALINSDVFGPEGLSEVGLEASWLAPLPWYSLLTVSGMDGQNDALFNSPLGRDLAGFASLRNVFDVTDDSTFEAGLSYAVGNNQDRKLAQALGAHLVYKWRPARESTDASAMVTLEGILSRRPSDPSRLDAPPLDTGGFYGILQWQLAKRWYVGGRFELLAHKDVQPSVSDVTTKQSVVLVFAPTEFSAFRIQGNVVEPKGNAPPIYEAFLQANFTVGAHPAHSY